MHSFAGLRHNRNLVVNPCDFPLVICFNSKIFKFHSYEGRIINVQISAFFIPIQAFNLDDESR